MIAADLYLNRIQWLPYLSDAECQAAGAGNCEDFLVRLHNGTLAVADCDGLAPRKRYALNLAFTAADWVPPLEALMMPQPVTPGLVEINDPGPEAPILVSANSDITQTLLTAVLATTSSPFFLLLIDCLGHTVDMAVVYDTFTPAKLEAGLSASGLSHRAGHRRLVIPGLCAALAPQLADATGWEISVGPVCALELPLFFGERWQAP